MKYFLSILSLSILVVMLTFCLGAFNNYYYPNKYQQEIMSASQTYNLKPSLIASIINVESGYKKDVKSNKGAIGLMQIMPETAEWICQTKGINYETINLVDEKTNINLGCAYLEYLFKNFQSIENVICAYNAGPTKVKSWLKDKELSLDGEKLEKIPYLETKNYLNKVKKNLKIYQKRF